MFERKDTNVLKGIAILAMIFHHLYPNNTAIPVTDFGSVDLLTLIASEGKVCVALLTILSGYGLSESFKRVNKEAKFYHLRFCLSHYIQLLSIYWCVYIMRFIFFRMQGIRMRDIYGNSVKYFVLDILGIGDWFNAVSYIGGWYMSAIVAFYWLFPLLQWLVKKLKFVPVIIAHLPWVYYLYKGDINMHTDWAPFYISSFILGIYLSESGALNRLKEVRRKPVVIVVTILALAVAFVLRAIVTLPMDIVLAVSIICFSITTIGNMKGLNTGLACFGKYSADIWLMEAGMRGLVANMGLNGYIMQYVVCMFFALGIAMLLESIKDGIGITELVKRVRKRIANGREITKSKNVGL